MTEQRRYTDHVKKASDHDILIQVHTEIKDLAESQKINRQELKDFADKIDARCETRLNIINKNDEKVLGKSMFKWLYGLLVLGLATLYSVAVMNTVSATKNESQITQNGIQIGLNAEALDKLIERGK